MIEHTRKTPKEMTILVIGGSPRAHGRTQAISQYAETALQSKGFTVRRIELSEFRLPMYDGTAETGASPSVIAWKQVALDADGFFITSPDYHNGMSGALKNALDFLGGDHFRRKPTAIAALAGGGKGGMNALNNMRIVLRGIYALILSEQAVVDKNQLDENRQVVDPVAIKRLDVVVNELAAMVPLLTK